MYKDTSALEMVETQSMSVLYTVSQHGQVFHILGQTTSQEVD